MKLSVDYWFLRQVHIDFMKAVCIFVKTFWKNIYFVYVTKYMMCVFMKYLIIMTKKSNLSHYWIRGTSIIPMAFPFPKRVKLKRQDRTLIRDDLKLPGDGRGIPKSQGRGWRFESRLWNLLSTWRKTCQVVNCLLCFGAGLSAFCLKKKKKKKAGLYLHL